MTALAFGLKFFATMVSLPEAVSEADTGTSIHRPVWNDSYSPTNFPATAIDSFRPPLKPSPSIM